MTTVTHHEVFRKFKPWKGEVEPGFHVNFLGAKTRNLYDSNVVGVPFRQYTVTDWPTIDNRYLTWIILLESVATANQHFTMVELGAGWGRWLANAAVALRVLEGPPYTLVGVEGEPTHFEWLKSHLEDNGVDLRQCVLVEAVVAAQEGEVWFQTGRPSEWYGQEILNPWITEDLGQDTTSRKTRSVTLKALLDNLDMVDLIDVDIQGAELTVLRAAAAELDQKVKRVHIGTHNGEIEEGLRDLFRSLGWAVVHDFPGNAEHETPWGTIRFQDGVQTWINRRLVNPEASVSKPSAALTWVPKPENDGEDAASNLNVVAALADHAEEAVRDLTPLFRAVDAPSELTFQDWAMLFSLALRYKPDTILEIGRGHGSSTCVFLEVTRRLNCRFVSFDTSGSGWKVTWPKISEFIGTAWIDRALFIDDDIMTWDPEAILPRGSGALLVFWEDRREGLAQFVVTNLFKRLNDKTNLVVVHDITDSRWGLNLIDPNHVRCGPFSSAYEDLLELYEFWHREKIEPRSPVVDAVAHMEADPEGSQRLAASLPSSLKPLIGRGGHWVYFQLPRHSEES